MLKLLVQQHYFDAIKSGQKTVEGRLNKPRYNDLVIGMQLQFEGLEKEVVTCVIMGINRYPDFASMLAAEGVEAMLPGVASLQEGVKLYESFPGYKQDVQQVGALAIRIRVIKSA